MAETTRLSVTRYKKGTYIFIEGNETREVFYIVKEGKVQVSRSVDRIMHSNGDVVGTGDFFGVISAMSGHPSTETAIALTDVVLISVRKEQFGFLIQQSTSLAMKIIRFFSKRLRTFDALLTQLSAKKQGDEEADASQIFDIAEYYFKAGTMSLALYAYQKYVDLVPGGEKQALCLEKMERYARFKTDAFNSKANASGFNQRYKKSTFIFCEHEPGEELYIIQQGKVKITKMLGGQEVLLAILKSGDIFGEMALLENKPRSASAIAYDGDVGMLAVNRQNFSSMVVEQPQLATRLITILSDRIWSIYRQINNILIGDPVIRTLDTLLTIVLKEKTPIKRKEKYIFEFGIKELVNMLGLSYGEGKFYVEEALNDSSLFRVEANKIICDDLEELAKRVQAYLKKLEIMRKNKVKG